MLSFIKTCGTKPGVAMKFSDGGTLSPDDIQSRIGKLTASRMIDAMDFLKSGKESAARSEYKYDVAAERLTGVVAAHYVTSHMQHGIDTEPAAKEAYVRATKRKIRSTGFLDHPAIEYFGATPDGFVEDGLIEIKCPGTKKFLRWALSGEAPEEHKPQMLAQMAVTRKPWVDFVAFDPRMPAGSQLLIKRFTHKPEDIAEVEAHARRFLDEVDVIIKTILECRSVS